MTIVEATALAEEHAQWALAEAEGDWASAHRIMVAWAERDPRLREAIRVYTETIEAAAMIEPQGNA